MSIRRPHARQRVHGEPRTGRKWASRRFLLLAIACALLAIALLRPAVKLPRASYELLFVLDITQSMNTPDMTSEEAAATRLEAAKRGLRAVLEKMPCGSRVGLAVFTEYRSFLLLAPLEACEHFPEIAGALARLDWRMGWAGASEVSKGLHFAGQIARQLVPRPVLVFVSDGHEAPALPAGLVSSYDDRPGEIAGLVVGAGGLVPSPIPKFDMEGRRLGFWTAADVNPGGASANSSAAAASGESAVEHLSSLREPYLQALAAKHGLEYHRLTTPEALIRAVLTAQFARYEPIDTPLSPALASIALALLTAALLLNRRT